MKNEDSFFLILGLGHPLRYWKENPKYETTEYAFPKFHAKMVPVFISDSGISKKRVYVKTNQWYALFFEPGYGELEVAQRIADCLFLSICLIKYGIPSEWFKVISLPNSILKKNRLIMNPDILSIYPEEILFMECGYGAEARIPREELEYCLKIVPTLFNEKELFNASAYLYRSISTEIPQTGGLTEDQIESGNSINFVQNAMKDSFLNAYKSLESIFGEPNKERKKFKRKLISKGLEPDKIMELIKGKREKTIDKFYKFQKIRDKIAAHAKTKDVLSFDDLNDCQRFAREVNLCLIDKITIINT